MSVTGLYITHRVQHTAIPYVKTYGEVVLKDIVPAFANLSVRATAIADAEFQRLGHLPASGDCDGDMSVQAEAAQDKGQVFYDTMMGIRQSTLNLFAAGLFHLLEQKLADICRDGAFGAAPPGDTKLSVVAEWYRVHFNLDLTKLSAWPKIDQLRLLANSVKHGEGDSAAKLRTIRPDIFEEPTMKTMFPDMPSMYVSRAVQLPLAGEDIFVTTDVFTEFSQAANAFVAEIAEHFAAHQNDHYLVGD